MRRSADTSTFRREFAACNVLSYKIIYVNLHVCTLSSVVHIANTKT